ncbi:MAG: LysE family translocator [Cyclobacteriaceae bacterium]|jgi:threonine/homoserine/homoserine lactone efflux protein|nr:LysE family translocator [Flammeovirgaceae bacterium]
MEIAFNGIKFGVVLAFLIGPVFFTIIQTSIERGFWKGALVALGVSVSDTLYVAICYLGLFQFLSEPKFRTNMAYVGGAILILFGLYHLLIKSRKAHVVTVQTVNENRSFKYFFKGFVINGVSPMVLIFWVATLSMATVEMGYSGGWELFLFFLTLLLTVLATDVIKAYLAGKLRSLITHRFLIIMNVAVGIFLIIFGIQLLLKAKTAFDMLH